MVLVASTKLRYWPMLTSVRSSSNRPIRCMSEACARLANGNKAEMTNRLQFIARPNLQP